MNRHRIQKNSQTDWHPADVKAALEKKGWSLRRLSIHNGLSANALSMALKPAYTFAKAEQHVADALGIRPQDIWPSRYNEDGTRKQKRMGNPNWLAGVPRKSSQDGLCCHVKDRRVA